MAARIRKQHQEEVRARIQVSQLINVLERQAFGGGEEISPTRMKAIEILLRKSLPDLTAVEISGDPENPLQTVQRIELTPLVNGTGPATS